MALGVEGMPAGTVVRKATLLTLGTALLAASITAVFLSMRSVMDIGGSCASGGPYAATPCPDGAWLAPVGIFVGLGACVLLVIGSFPGAGPQPVVLAWPALFLSLGWNFWQYGLDPPSGDGVVWGWIICGVVFVVMGGLPLVAVVTNLRAVLWGGTAPPAVPRNVQRLSPSAAQRARATQRAGVDRTAAATPEERRDEHLVARLERLSALYRRGDLTVEEYQAAKAAVLSHEHGEAGGS